MALSLLDVLDDLVFADLPVGMVAPRQSQARNILNKGQRAIPIDFSETATGYELHADLPGIKKEDIKLDVDGEGGAGVITIGVVQKKEETKESHKAEEGVTFHRMERSQLFRDRALRLPDDVDMSKIDAKYEDGVLRVIIPKAPKEDRTKRIAIA